MFRGGRHSGRVVGRPSATTYPYGVKSKAGGATPATSADSTFTTLDTTPPVISGIVVTSIGGTSATIQWTTNEAADSQVEYGLTGSYGSTTTLDPTLGTAHTVAVGGLTSATTNPYRVKSKDAAGNPATSARATTTTNDTPPPMINAVFLMKKRSPSRPN